MKKEKIKFYKGKHIYKLGKKQLTSCTTFIGKFFPKFDAKAIARKLAKFPVNKAKKHGVRYFLKEWKEAAEHGTEVHWLLEQHVLDQEPEDLYTFEPRTVKKYYEGTFFLDAFTTLYCHEIDAMTPELIIHDEELGIAGTIDLAVFRGNKVTLIDWKTNKKIDQKAYKGDKALGILKDMEACNYNKYALQLTLYMYMLERQGYECGELIIVHLAEDKYTEYKIDYDKYLVCIKEMIKNGSSTNNKTNEKKER